MLRGRPDAVMSRRRKISLGLLAGFMTAVGVMHFVEPGPFVAIVPGWLPWALALVYISGVFEILGGVGLLVPRTRVAAAWGLVALFVAVFPANINMAVNNIPFDGKELHPMALWGRLPLQVLLIYWAWTHTRRTAAANPVTVK